MLVKGVKNGEASVVKVTVDVWSEATKNVVVALEDYFSVAGYTYQSFIKDTLTVGEYTLGNKTETLVRLYAAGRECSVVVAKPLHSKKYYQELLAKDDYYTSYVTLDWYFENTSAYTSSITPYYDMFTGYEKQGAQEKDTWHSGRITLAEFVALYDDMVAIYERTVSEYNTGVRYGRFVDTKGVVDQDGNVQKGYVMASKFQTNKIDYAYFAPMTIEQGEMKTFESATALVDRNSVSKLEPSLTTDEQAVVDYWSNAGYTISYEIVKRYSDGTPLVKVSALNSAVYNFVTDISAADYTEDGIYYFYVKATKGDESGVCIKKTYDIYNSTDSIVEYENFKHNDSQYAVLVYWAKFASQGFKYYTSSINVTTPDQLGATSLDKAAFGTGTDANTLYLLSQGTTTLSAGSSSITATDDPNYSDREIGYIAYSWASEDTQTKLDTAHSVSVYQYLCTYVLPRHSIEYYQAFADQCGNLEMLYKSTNSNLEGLGRMRYLYMTDVADGSVSLYYSGNVWSSSNQTMSGNVTANIQTLVENYDAFAQGKVPMMIMMHMVGTTVESSESRLYEIGFHKSVNS